MTRDRYGYRFPDPCSFIVTCPSWFPSWCCRRHHPPDRRVLPTSITSPPGTSLSENSRLPSWTWAYPGALLPITRASRTLDDFTHQGRSSSRGLLSFRVLLDRPPWVHHPLMRFGPAAGFFCGRRWTSGEGCPPLLKFLPSDVCFR